jgi:F-type H+-transporting ATPase subunit a
MLAGHITLNLFAGFVAMLGASLGVIGWIVGILPLAMTVVLIALELLVAALQAYVFAMLTCIYLNDTLHPGHRKRRCLLQAIARAGVALSN